MGATVYVAGPYTASTPELVQFNVDCAVDAGNTLIELGFVPYVPHLSHYLHLRKQQDYETWMQIDLIWLRKCEVLLRIPGVSKGADREIEEAKTLNMPVFYCIPGVVKWFRGEGHPAKGIA